MITSALSASAFMSGQAAPPTMYLSRFRWFRNTWRIQPSSCCQRTNMAVPWMPTKEMTPGFSGCVAD
eukprot:9473654-Pyramimonas_sp.AAC.2